jgi:hypothetical protein
MREVERDVENKSADDLSQERDGPLDFNVVERERVAKMLVGRVGALADFIVELKVGTPQEGDQLCALVVEEGRER